VVDQRVDVFVEADVVEVAESLLREFAQAFYFWVLAQAVCVVDQVVVDAFDVDVDERDRLVPAQELLERKATFLDRSAALQLLRNSLSRKSEITKIW
jgi:hypothetical protein